MDRTTLKSQHIVQHPKALDRDTVLLWQEIKLNWYKVPLDSKWWAREKKPNYMGVFGFNKREKTENPTLPGGTAVILNRGIGSRLIKKGRDKLGCWTWA